MCGVANTVSNAMHHTNPSSPVNKSCHTPERMPSLQQLCVDAVLSGEVEWHDGDVPEAVVSGG